MLILDPLPKRDADVINANLQRIAAALDTLLTIHQATTLNLVFSGREPAGTATGGTSMAQQLGDAEQITATISPMDRAGNAAPVETGTVVWASSDTSIVTVTPDATNELDALIVAVGALGTVTITVSADADLGAGVTTITDTADVEVVAGQASNLGLSFGTATPKP